MMAGHVWGWIVALCVFTQILLFTAAQLEESTEAPEEEAPEEEVPEDQKCQCEKFKCSKGRRYAYAKFGRKVNVAVGKQATSSSVQSMYSKSAPACIVVNGKPVTDRLFAEIGSPRGRPACMMTSPEEEYPWWQVDLGKPYLLAGINITWGDWMVTVWGVSVSLDNRQLFLYKENSKNDTTTIPVPVNTTARFVKLKREVLPDFTNYSYYDKYRFVLCHVEVYVCRPGYYGPECDGICDKPVCWNSQICSGVDGSCPPEETEVLKPVECSIMSVVAACIFDAVVIILCAVAAKTIPRKEEPKPLMIVTEAGKTETKDKGDDDKEIDDGDEEDEDDKEEDEDDKEEDEEDKEKDKDNKEGDEDDKEKDKDDKEEDDD